MSLNSASSYRTATAESNQLQQTFEQLTNMSQELNTSIIPYDLQIGENATGLPDTSDDAQSWAFLRIYLSLALLTFLVGLVRSITYTYCTQRSSVNLHAQVFERMTRAPVRFFDMTPRGRIVNRFSSDMSCVDSELPDNLFNSITVTQHTLQC